MYSNKEKASQTFDVKRLKALFSWFELVLDKALDVLGRHWIIASNPFDTKIYILSCVIFV